MGIVASYDDKRTGTNIINVKCLVLAHIYQFGRNTLHSKLSNGIFLGRRKGNKTIDRTCLK